MRLEVGQTGRSVGRRPCASLRRAVRTSFVRTEPSAKYDKYIYVEGMYEYVVYV